MAVHLNARLKTRYIPFLFAGAFLLSLGVSIVARASAAPARSPSSENVAPPAPDSREPQEPQVSPEELRSVMSESVDPTRLDRRPGFSTIIVAPQSGDSAVNETQTLDYSDQLPVQPPEAAPDSDQR